MAGRPVQPRLELGPLLAAARCDTVIELATQISFPRRTITRWQRDGIPFFSADRAATDLKLHPLSVWGDEYLAGT